MSSQNPDQSPFTPTWPLCGQDPTPENAIGCCGIHVPGHAVCLAHLSDVHRDAYLATLAAGSDIDHRGTTFTRPLLDALLNALRDAATGHPRLGATQFDSAVFEGFASFRSVIFEGDAGFQSATFKSSAHFAAATFKHSAEFGSADFEGTAGFWLASFKGVARFASAAFEDEARFASAIFENDCSFDSATFQYIADFTSATFEINAWFQAVIFEGAAAFRSVVFKGIAGFAFTTFQRAVEFGEATFRSFAVFVQVVFKQPVNLGPLVCEGRVMLSGAVFEAPAILMLAARAMECRRTRWSSTAEIRLRYATVDFAHAVFEYPLTIAAEAVPFELHGGYPLEEGVLATAPDAAVRISSLRGVDAAHLVLADVDLSWCLFTGTVHLDQIRLEGTCCLAGVPDGVHWRRGHLVRFTPRRTLAEEHCWRARQPTAVPGWNTGVFDAGDPGPAQLAPAYRALRKALEDAKDEPGAADFYYGEMEMRRHDRSGSTRAERGLLYAYWLVSGYGLRASRALGWLAAAMLATVALLMGFGLPQDPPKQVASGTMPSGGKVTLEIDKSDPQNPTAARFTGERFEKALNVTLNSVVFRSSGQDLTTAGTYIEMTSRLTEPALLGLAALAVRNRVKR